MKSTNLYTFFSCYTTNFISSSPLFCEITFSISITFFLQQIFNVKISELHQLGFWFHSGRMFAFCWILDYVKILYRFIWVVNECGIWNIKYNYFRKRIHFKKIVMWGYLDCAVCKLMENSETKKIILFI